MTLVPLMCLLLLEGALRLIGFGYQTTFFIAAEDGWLTTNPKFGWQFHSRQSASSPTPVKFAKQKPSGTRRIFVLGESAAAGTPDPAFSFSRMLALMYEERGAQVEIINAAMRGVDSHIVRQIAEECATLSPDLFIVYTGNNEMIGLHSPSPGAVTWFKTPAVLAFEDSVKRLKISQLLESALRLRTKTKARQQDMEYIRQQRLPFDDPSREVVYRNYRANLESICSAATRASAKAIVCSMAVNLRDQPPLQSVHRTGMSPSQLDEWNRLYTAGSKAQENQQLTEALRLFRAAAKIDDHFAELLFRQARCEEMAGQFAEAQKSFGAARDWDALQFRSDSRVNGIARDVATRFGTNLVRYVDIEQSFARSALATHGVPGDALFQEHVHFTFTGDHLLASTLLPEVSLVLGLSPAATLIQRDDCARRLAYTKIEEANVFSAVAQMISKPPFLDELEHNVRLARLQARARDALRSLTTNDIAEAEATYRSAIAGRPDDWMLRYNYARFLTEVGRHAAAVPEFQHVSKKFPHECVFRMSLGMAMLQAQQTGDAVAELSAAVKLNPDLAPAQQALATAMSRR